MLDIEFVSNLAKEKQQNMLQTVKENKTTTASTTTTTTTTPQTTTAIKHERRLTLVLVQTQLDLLQLVQQRNVLCFEFVLYELLASDFPWKL